MRMVTQLRRYRNPTGCVTTNKNPQLRKGRLFSLLIAFSYQAIATVFKKGSLAADLNDNDDEGTFWKAFTSTFWTLF